jgi:hypothetical protein
MDWTNFVGMTEVAEDVPSEYLSFRIRNWRNGELSATDFTQLSDSPKDKVAFAQYRQDLRDLPSQGADPRQWVFPVKP